MNKSGITIKALASLVFALSLYSAAQAQARVFVSGLGNDANPCSRTQPCRTFQHGHDVVAAGGEVIALDSAGYGGVSITKSVTINGNGVYAGITVTSGNGIDISIGASDTVVLRGLTLNGAGGTIGVSLTAGGNLHVENCVAMGFSGSSIFVAIGAGASAHLFVKDTICRGNVNGIVVDAGSGSLDHVRLEQNSNIGLAVELSGTHVSIANSVASGNDDGLDAGSSAELNIEACLVANNSNTGITSFSSATVRVSNSTVTNNFFGLFNGGATLKSRGNNTVDGNTTNTSGVITALSPT